MGFDFLRAKLKLFHELFIAAPKDWKLPKRCEVLVYDACGAEILAPYLTSYSVAIMPVRGESVNVPCLLRAFFNRGFWKGRPLNAYAEAFIQAASPEVVITFIDNNAGFYGISKRFHDTKTILLQNGIRDHWLEGHGQHHEYHVDYMLVFGSCVGTYYGAYISGEVLPVGALKNNQARISGDIMDGTVLFISQYHDKPRNNEPLYVLADGTPVYFDKFYMAEVQVLSFLKEWCADNKMRLLICGRSQDEIGPERDFFADILTECAWEYVPMTDSNSSYRLVDTAGIVVFIDSTLGYESIGRGKKTACLSCRGVALNRGDRKFGWPADLPDNGPFWTNDQDEKQFQRIMDYLNTIKDEDWEQTRQRYASELMEFDPGNTRFMALLDQLLPKNEGVKRIV